MPKRTCQVHIYVSIAVLCNALVALLSAPPLASAQAQTDSAAIVQSQENQSAGLAATWLGSSDARTRAWGAYLALRDRRRELLPQLIGLAEAYPVKIGPLSPTERDDHDATLGVLDAIIQMDGKIPPERAAKLYPDFPVQALILLGREGSAASGFLLNIFREENSQIAAAAHSQSAPLIFFATNDKTSTITMSPMTYGTLAWLAVGDLLMKLRPPGFAAEVLGSFTVDARVRVADEGSGGVPAGGIGGSCSSGGPPPRRPGWPLVGNYLFWGANYLFSENILLAGGTDPSFYTRIVGGAVPISRGGETTCQMMPALDMLREHFLTSLAGEPAGDPPVRSSVQATITWRNNEQYLGDLHAFINRQQVLFDKLSSRLTDAGQMSVEGGASTRPSLLVRISDERSKKPSSLPVLQNTESNVKIMN
jgi:hypothetical protein